MGRGNVARVAAIAMLIWFVASLALWALRPYNESIEVGVDHTLIPPQAASVVVKCNAPLSTSAFSGKTPKLNAQPADKPKLALTHTPCKGNHQTAQLVFGVDAATFVGFFAWFLKPRFRKS